MDIFCNGTQVDTPAFFDKLFLLYQRLGNVETYLSEDDMEVLSRLLPLRNVAIVTSTLSQQTPAANVLPPAYQQLIRYNSNTGSIACAMAPILVILLIDQSHFSSIVVDLVEGQAHRFDSAPSTRHQVRAMETIEMLYNFKLIHAPEFNSQIEFVQKSTQCGIYALRVAMEIDAEFVANEDRRILRSTVIQLGMQKAADEASIMSVRTALYDRVRNVIGLTYNARSELVGVESAEQSELLGPFASRASLRRLMLRGQANCALLSEALGQLVPHGINIALHTVVKGTTATSPEALETMRNAGLTLIFLTHDATQVVDSVALLVRTPDGQLTAILPDSSTDGDSSLEALCTALPVTCYHHPNVSVTRVAAPPVLVLTLYAWWQYCGQLVEDDQIGAELLKKFTELSADAPPHRPSTVRIPYHTDWLHRRMLAIALDDGHRRLVALASRASGDVEIMVSMALNQFVTNRTRLAVRQNRIARDHNARMSTFETTCDELVKFAADNAPLRWRSGSTDGAIRLLYYDILAQPAARSLVGQLQDMFDMARTYVLAGIEASTLITPIQVVIKSVFEAWPVMILHRSADGAYNPVLPTMTLMSTVIEYALGATVGQPIPVVMCPVAVVDTDGTDWWCDYVTIFKMEEMRVADKLNTTATHALCPLRPPNIVNMGGCTEHGAPSTHMRRVLLTGDQEFIPRFFIGTAYGETLVPMVFLRKTAAVVSSAVMEF